MTTEVFTPCQEMAKQLEKRGREISKQLAGEIEEEKIYVLLLAWGVEYLKIRQRMIC